MNVWIYFLTDWGILKDHKSMNFKISGRNKKKSKFLNCSIELKSLEIDPLKGKL